MVPNYSTGMRFKVVNLVIHSYWFSRQGIGHPYWAAPGSLNSNVMLNTKQSFDARACYI